MPCATDARSINEIRVIRAIPASLPRDGLGAEAPTARHGGSNPSVGSRLARWADGGALAYTDSARFRATAALRGAHAMRWQDAERSTNVDDVRGRRFGGGGMPIRLGGMGGMSLGGLVAIMAITYLLGGDPLAVLTGGVPTETAAPGPGDSAPDRRRRQPVRQGGAARAPRPSGARCSASSWDAATPSRGWCCSPTPSRRRAAPTRRRSGPSTVRPTSGSTSTCPSTTSSIAASARQATSPRPT